MDEKLQKVLDIINGEKFPFEVGITTSGKFSEHSDNTELFDSLIKLEKLGKVKRKYNKIDNTIFWSPI